MEGLQYLNRAFSAPRVLASASLGRLLKAKANGTVGAKGNRRESVKANRRKSAIGAASYQPRAAPEEHMQIQSPALKVRFNCLTIGQGWPGAQRRLASLRRLEVGERAGHALNVGNVFEQLGNRVPFAANERLSCVVG